jgi:L-alanine-DL-glutamate epimerase-like enolase superfamily enzyme
MTDAIVVSRVEVIAVEVDLGRDYRWSTGRYRKLSRVIVRMRSKDGATGIGLTSGQPLSTIVGLCRQMGEWLIGRDVSVPEVLASSLFATTVGTPVPAGADRPGPFPCDPTSRGQIMAAIGSLDLAIWDLRGHCRGKSVCELLGGVPGPVPAYASGGYYADSGSEAEAIEREVAAYVEQGFSAAKIKIGGADLAIDGERIAAARRVLGPGGRLMIDANCAYDMATAVEASRRFAVSDPFWFEEPLHWYEGAAGLADFARRVAVPLACGESEITRFGARDLVDFGAVRYLQLNATRAGGLTELVKAAGHARTKGISIAPHHEPMIHAHIVAATPGAFGVEIHADAARDPFLFELFDASDAIRDGHFHLSARPGFGFSIDENALSRLRTG